MKVLIGFIGVTWIAGIAAIGILIINEAFFKSDEQKKAERESAEASRRWENSEKGLPEDWHEWDAQKKDFWLKANGKTWMDTVD
jgi:hypothetical protein